MSFSFFIIVVVFAVPCASNILMPHSFFATRSESAMGNPTNYQAMNDGKNNEMIPTAFEGPKDDLESGNINNFET